MYNKNEITILYNFIVFNFLILSIQLDYKLSSRGYYVGSMKI